MSDMSKIHNGLLKSGAALVSFGVCATLSGAEPIVLAERGKVADCAIMIPADAAPALSYAAEELRDFTEKATGVRLPIVIQRTGNGER